MADETEQIPADWYEYEGSGEERYWDGAQWTDETRPLGSAHERESAAEPGGLGGPQPVQDENRVVYKVLTQKDRFFGGKFDPQKLEGALNSYAAEGWAVVGIATADIPSFGSSRQELVVVMSRSQ